MSAPASPRLRTDGKFFQLGTERVWLKSVTYGPFPPDYQGQEDRDFAKIRAAGFNSIRTFTLPTAELLDAAEKHGLLVFAGLQWRQYEDFQKAPTILSSAKSELTEWLKIHSQNPTVAAVFVGNEIPSDLVRWIRPKEVLRNLEELIELGRKKAPDLLFAYANYPSTEYLEPANADFTAFNIYLENREDFARYTRRLQNIAGDRPLVISEFGLDSNSQSEAQQAEVISWALKTAKTEMTSGLTVFAWSDLWWNANQIVEGWSFGITDRDGNEKLAYKTCRGFQPNEKAEMEHRFSIVICTHNGAEQIQCCLESTRNLRGGNFEVIVVDDGSTDKTSEIVARNFPEVRLVTIKPSGLSAARNSGAEVATGEIIAYTDDDCEVDPDWLLQLDTAFSSPEIAAAGGPNLPPFPASLTQAIIQSAPGAPSHVLLNDTEAEHLPGCNIAIRKNALQHISGFDPIFRTAGDDVDLCWRLRDAGLALAFVPGAFVWHKRRSTIPAYLRQQRGYGRAEKQLISKFPERFTSAKEARWEGAVYSGAPISARDADLIYHGEMGLAGYQSVVSHVLPTRPLPAKFNSERSRFLLRSLQFLQPIIRRWYRSGTLFSTRCERHPESAMNHIFNHRFTTDRLPTREQLLDFCLHDDWEPDDISSSWDLKKGDSRLLVAREQLGGNHGTILLRSNRRDALIIKRIRNQFA